jgi:hypothetical protein
MKTHRILLCLTLAMGAFVGTANAQQWVWKDASGNRVFSDKAPPPGIPDSAVIKRPGGNAVRVVPVRPQAKTSVALGQANEAAAAASAASAAAASAGAGASAARRAASAGVDPELARRKQAEEAAAKASDAAQNEKVAKAKAESCSRARESERNLSSGMRIARTTEKGEREFMNEQQVAAEVAKARASIKDNCN